MKKKLIGLFFAIFCLTFISFAQEKEKYKEKIKARKVAFISDKLSLTPEEAQQFWPLYNEYEGKKNAINKTHRKKINFQSMTDEAAAAYIDQQLDREEQLLALKKSYIYKMKNVLPIQKIARLPRVENRFKQWMLEQIKTRRKGNN